MENLDILQQLGLSKGEITVYGALLEYGECTPADIIRHTNLKRGDVYNKLYSLKKLVLIEELNKKKKTFRANHPSVIQKLIDKQYKTLEDNKKNISVLLPSLISNYNLANHKPGMQYFEGVDGMEKVLNDSLTATGTIYSYADIEPINKYYQKINKAYVAKRIKLKKSKKILVANTPYNRDFFARQGEKETDVRFLKSTLSTFGTVMQIYDNKISYITLQPSSVIAIIIEDPYISKLHKKLFEYNWENAQPIT